jgi:hypothetical protein
MKFLLGVQKDGNAHNSQQGALRGCSPKTSSFLLPSGYAQKCKNRCKNPNGGLTYICEDAM